MADNIITLGGITKLDLPTERVLDGAKELVKGGVIIIGYDEDEELYFASSIADGGDVLWLLEKAKKELLDEG